MQAKLQVLLAMQATLIDLVSAGIEPTDELVDEYHLLIVDYELSVACSNRPVGQA
jgi:hypothetical protein